MSHSVFATKTSAAVFIAITLLGFSIPISTALSNVMAVVVMILWLTLPGLTDRAKTVLTSPVCRAALILFMILLVGCFYGDASLQDRLRIISKYGDLLLIGIIFSLSFQFDFGRKVLLGFAAAQVLTLLLSYLLLLQLLPEGAWRTGGGVGATVFKSHIQQGWLMALFAYGCLVLASEAASQRLRLLFYVGALAAAANVLFVIEGKTGYVTLFAVLFLYFFRRFGLRGTAISLLVFGVFAAVALTVPSQFSSGVGKVIDDVRNWDPKGGARTSQGLRLDFWKNSIPIVASNPLIGVGTGGFSEAFAMQVSGTDIYQTKDPHNEYLMVTIQTGVLGLAAMLYLFFTAWKFPTGGVAVVSDMRRGLVLAMAVGCLFNSFLLAHTEGMFFAWAVGVFAALHRGQTVFES